MNVIIIKGNPKYINHKTAKNYYSEIEAFLLANGVKKVSFDPGEDYTCPKKGADFYIGHSRGASRIRCMSTGEEWRFLQFGDPDGVMHPIDRKWHEKPTGKPPKEHFLFIDEQKDAIRKIIEKVSGDTVAKPSTEALKSLQW